MQINKDTLMITLQQAIELATKAHKDQWRKPSTVVSDIWDGYKQQTEVICENGNKIVWCNGNTFLEYEPYIIHPLAVMNMMDTEVEKIAAVLHDVFEDTEVQLRSCPVNNNYWISFKGIEYKINSSLWAVLYALTKPNSDWGKFKEKGHYQSYAGYIHYISLNRIATKVKIADIIHNLSCSPSDHAKQKYLKTIPVLLKSI